MFVSRQIAPRVLIYLLHHSRFPHKRRQTHCMRARAREWSPSGESAASRRRPSVLFALRLMGRTRVFCDQHALPLSLVALAALGTGMQLIAGRYARPVGPLGRDSAVGAAEVARTAATAAGDVGEVDLFDLDQLQLWECKPSTMGKMRVRIFDLDAMLTPKAPLAQGEALPAQHRIQHVANLVRSVQPVDSSAVHAAERAHLRKKLRSCEAYFGVEGVGDDVQEPAPGSEGLKALSEGLMELLRNDSATQPAVAGPPPSDLLKGHGNGVSGSQHAPSVVEPSSSTLVAQKARVSLGGSPWQDISDDDRSVGALSGEDRPADKGLNTQFPAGIFNLQRPDS